MKKLLELSANFPRLTIFSLIIITSLAVYLMPNLRIEISAQSMMVKSNPLWYTYEKSLNTYGSDDVVIIYIQDENLFSTEKLRHIDHTVKALEALKYVKQTRSLFNVPNFKEVDGYIEKKPFLNPIPSDQKILKQILSEAIDNPLIVGNLISENGQSMAINLYLDNTVNDPNMSTEITQSIEELLKPLSTQVDVVFQMGSAYLKDAISRQIQKEQRRIIPVALCILLLVLAVSLKRINCSIVTLVTSAISIALTMSFMAFLDVPVNILTSIIPALLIIIGSTEDVHLLTEYHSGIQRGLDRDLSILNLPKTQSVAISLAFITTFVGFISITVNDLEILTQFGWVVSMGLLINFVVTILFIPAYLKLFGGKQFKKSKSINLYQSFAKTIFLFVIRHKRATLIVSLLITIFFIGGIQSLQMNNNTLSYFSEDSEIQIRSRLVHDNLSGIQTFSIILDSGIEGTFLKVRYLEDVRKLQNFLDQRKVFDKSFSFADFIMLVNKVMDGEPKPSMPEEDELIDVYMSFISYDSVKSYVSHDFSNTRIVVRHNIESSQKLDEELHTIRVFIDEKLQTNLTVQFTGEAVLTNRASDSMASGQVKSLLLMVFVIFVLVSLLYVDFRAGLLAVVPNIFPVIILFGVMGYFHIPLDMGTTMVAVIALGICVDDTIHFLSRYHFNTRGTQDVEEALLKTVEHEATPIMTTSLALALGFASLTLSSFQPIANFGALSAMVMLLAAFSTFVLTPILLSHTRLVTVWDMLSHNQKTEVLQKGVFFKGLKNFEIKRAILSGNIKHYEKGEIIIEQGHRGTDMFVIVGGAAKVTRKEKGGSSYKLGTIESGELFGELALLSNYRRTARVTASEATKVLVIKKAGFRQLGRFNPRISMKLFYNLSSVIGKRLIDQLDDYQKLREDLAGPVSKEFFKKQIKHEIQQGKAQHENFSLLSLQIAFKTDNGSALSDIERENGFKVISRKISEQVRSLDIFTRWDENNFIILMPGTPADLAECVPRRIIASILKTSAPHSKGFNINSILIEGTGSEGIDLLMSKLENTNGDNELCALGLEIQEQQV